MQKMFRAGCHHSPWAMYLQQSPYLHTLSIQEMLDALSRLKKEHKGDPEQYVPDGRFIWRQPWWYKAHGFPSPRSIRRSLCVTCEVPCYDPSTYRRHPFCSFSRLFLSWISPEEYCVRYPPAVETTGTAVIQRPRYCFVRAVETRLYVILFEIGGISWQGTLALRGNFCEGLWLHGSCRSR